ncbi:MAG: hypothetical protein LBG99_05205 [Propionibacteriaceae bacterium]|nr:hypothetical protein [Propionibacteriaceae bacterium]
MALIILGIYSFPRPLVSDPDTHGTVTVGANHLAAVLRNASHKTEWVQRDRTIDQSPNQTNAAYVFETTSLSSDARSLILIKTLIDGCQETQTEATTVIDPTLVRVTKLPINQIQRKEGKLRVVGSRYMTALLKRLDYCDGNLVEQMARMTTDLTDEKTSAALLVATEDNDAMRVTVVEAITGARDLHTSTAGQVADDATRVTLEATISEAEAMLNDAQPLLWEELDQQTQHLAQLNTRIETDTAAVHQSHNQWANPTPQRTQGSSQPSNSNRTTTGSNRSQSSTGGSSGTVSTPTTTTPQAKAVITWRQYTSDGICEFGGYISEASTQQMWVGITGFPSETDTAFPPSHRKGETWAYGFASCPTTDVNLLWAELR